MNNDTIIYVVWYDNMETFEDRFEDIAGVFSTRENAIKFIEDQGFVNQTKEHNRYWRYGDTWGLTESDEYGLCDHSILYIRMFYIDKTEAEQETYEKELK